jgi:hypothetical protein
MQEKFNFANIFMLLMIVGLCTLIFITLTLNNYWNEASLNHFVLNDKQPIFLLFSINFINYPITQDYIPEYPIEKNNNIQNVDVVKNGDFEHPTVPESAGFITFRKADRINEWIIGENSVDIVHKWEAASGSQSADLNGDSSGLIYQIVIVNPDKRYLLMLNYAGNYDGGDGIKKFQILWGNETVDTIEFNCTGKSGANMGWKRYKKILSPTDSEMNLGFRDITLSKGWGVVIDSVKLLEID